MLDHITSLADLLMILIPDLSIAGTYDIYVYISYELCMCLKPSPRGKDKFICMAHWDSGIRKLSHKYPRPLELSTVVAVSIVLVVCRDEYL